VSHRAERFPPGSSELTLSGVLSGAPVGGDVVLLEGGTWRVGPVPNETVALVAQRPLFSTIPLPTSNNLNHVYGPSASYGTQYSFYKTTGVTTQTSLVTAQDGSSAAPTARRTSAFCNSVVLKSPATWLLQASLAFGTNISGQVAATFTLHSSVQGELPAPRFQRPAGINSRSALYLAVFRTTVHDEVITLRWVNTLNSDTYAGLQSSTNAESITLTKLG
jgi:hypothetical protein